MRHGGGLRPVLLGNRVQLLACPKCGVLWCCSRHGDPSHAIARVLWEGTAGDWKEAYDLDDGISLNRWHLDQVARVQRSRTGSVG